MKRPNFFVVGAPKSGTTALCTYLGQHPRVYLCDPKEPHYFAEDFDGHRQITELEQYLALFSNSDGGHQVVGEGSVWYLYSSRALTNIRAFAPEAKIIVMLRNPLELVPSLHRQHCFSLYEDQQDLKTAWALQECRRRGERIPRLCRQPQLLQYGAVARLGEQMKRLLNIFPRSQVKAILFDDFITNPGKVYHDTLRFLGVEDDGRVDFPVVNQGKEYRGWLLPMTAMMMPMAVRNVLTRLRYYQLTKWIPVLLERLTTVPATGTWLDAQMHAEMVEYFRSDVLELGRLLEVDLEHWLDDDRRSGHEGGLPL